MSKDLIINVTDQNMRVIQCNSSKLYNKSRHFLRLHFKFNTAWTGLSKSVIFLGEENYEYPLIDDVLVVPSSFLTSNGFKFTLVGRDTSSDILVTTNTLTINLKDSDYTTDISTLDDDISDVYTVLLERFDDYYDSDAVDDLLNEYYTKSESDNLLNGKADVEHNHNTLYYTKSVTDELLSEKLDITDAFSGSYTDLLDKPSIPTKTSDLTNDSGFLTTHQDISGKANISDLSTVATSGSYDDLSDKPSIPSKTSDLVNDSGFLTEHQDLSDYIQKSSTTGLIRNDGSVDTNTYLTEHQSLSDYVQKSSTTGLLKNDGTVDTNNYLTSHQDISNYVQKSSTSGLLKNDGTVDTNQYLTSHQSLSGYLQSSDIADNLTTDNASKVLSAKQGKALSDLIGSAITYINQ